MNRAHTTVLYNAAIQALFSTVRGLSIVHVYLLRATLDLVSALSYTCY